MNYTAVIIEDDKDLRELLKTVLSEHNFSIHMAGTGHTGYTTVERTKPDVVILDLGLPDIDGETICSKIKSLYPETQVIILTAKDETRDLVKGFERGADDYISKPFVTDELISRIHARLRPLGKKNAVLMADDLALNTSTFEVKRKDQKITLTRTEYELLYYLLRNKNRVLTREMILNNVWGQQPDIETRVVDVYIGYLRKKIDVKNGHRLIRSKRGFGYMISDPS